MLNCVQLPHSAFFFLTVSEAKFYVPEIYCVSARGADAIYRDSRRIALLTLQFALKPVTSKEDLAGERSLARIFNLRGKRSVNYQDLLKYAYIKINTNDTF